MRRASRRQGQQRVNPTRPVCRSGEKREDASRSDLPLALAIALRVEASLEQDRRTDVGERGAQSPRIEESTTCRRPKNRAINLAQHPKRENAGVECLFQSRHPTTTHGHSVCHGWRSSSPRARCLVQTGERGGVHGPVNARVEIVKSRSSFRHKGSADNFRFRLTCNTRYIVCIHRPSPGHLVPLFAFGLEPATILTEPLPAETCFCYGRPGSLGIQCPCLPLPAPQHRDPRRHRRRVGPFRPSTTAPQFLQPRGPFWLSPPLPWACASTANGPAVAGSGGMTAS